MSGLVQSSAMRRLLLASESADVYSFIIDASSASSKTMTTSYMTLGEVRDFPGSTSATSLFATITPADFGRWGYVECRRILLQPSSDTKD